jgi:hypothetical protein
MRLEDAKLFPENRPPGKHGDMTTISCLVAECSLDAEVDRHMGETVKFRTPVRWGPGEAGRAPLARIQTTAAFVETYRRREAPS